MSMTLYFHLLPRVLEFYFFLILGGFLFLTKQERRRFFLLRLLLSTAVSVLVMNHLYYPLGLYRNSTNLSNLLIYGSGLLGLTFIAKCCFRISWSEATFCAVAGYGAQFVYSSLSEMMWRYFGTDGAVKYATQLILAGVVYSIIYLTVGRKLKKGQNFDLGQWRLLLLVVAAVLVEIVLCYNLRMQWMVSTDRFHMVWDNLLLAICSSAILGVQIGMLMQDDLQDRLLVLSQLRRREQEQFEVSSDTIDLINRKCHDMRHQIRTIGRDTNLSPEAIKEMERAINIYDSMFDTGSRALNIILTEKNLYCQAHEIALSCMADGSALSFMADTDIYSLFGNILDNAIQAVHELPKDQRIIGLSVRRRGDLLSVNAHNCYGRELRFIDGLPQTDGDPREHGFGTRSIVATAKKYGGTVKFSAEDGVFETDILFCGSGS